MTLFNSSSKCSLVFNHRDHKERREVADLRLICRFFVFTNPRMCSLWLNVCYIWNC